MVEGGSTAAEAAEQAPQRLAGRLTRLGGPVRERAGQVLRELGAVDQAVYSAVAATPTPVGALIGAGTGQAVAGLAERLPATRSLLERISR
jgi:hypothetical protein